MDRVREGLIPAVLGTAVTAAGYAMKQNRRTNKQIPSLVLGSPILYLEPSTW